MFGLAEASSITKTVISTIVIIITWGINLSFYTLEGAGFAMPPIGAVAVLDTTAILGFTRFTTKRATIFQSITMSRFTIAVIIRHFAAGTVIDFQATMTIGMTIVRCRNTVVIISAIGAAIVLVISALITITWFFGGIADG